MLPFGTYSNFELQFQIQWSNSHPSEEAVNESEDSTEKIIIPEFRVLWYN